MLATIDDINEDLIIVRTTDKQIKIELEKEKWKNIRYSLNKETSEIDEEETGSFTQFPIRLAWAITIHKSQGLTFENINIDAGSSFASGQVYVALSRCRSLDGISLLTPIQGEQILVDERVVDFHQKQVDEDLLEAMLEEAAYNYSVTKLLSAIKFHQVDLWIQQFTYAWHETLIEKYEAANALFLQLKNASSHLHLTGEKFLMQLNQLLSSKENDLITERILKAKQYFSYYLFDELIKPIQSFQDSIAKAKRVKLLNADLNKLINDLWKKLNAIQYLTFGNEELPITYINRNQPINKERKKVEKGATYKESLTLYLQGKNIQMIAAERGLSTTTIEGHLSRYIATGEINIHDFLTEEALTEIASHIKEDEAALQPLYAALNGKFSFGQLRMAMAHLKPHLQ